MHCGEWDDRWARSIAGTTATTAVEMRGSPKLDLLYTRWFLDFSDGVGGVGRGRLTLFVLLQLQYTGLEESGDTLAFCNRR